MKILVIGDSCTDRYVYCKCLRLCPDAPVPIVIPIETVEHMGMAGNVYANIRALGAEVDLITNVEKIEKTRYVDIKTNHMFIRVDTGEENIQAIQNIKQIEFEKYHAVVISDYCKGFLSEEDITYISKNADLTFLDTKKLVKDEFIEDVNFIKINQFEFEKSKSFISNFNINRKVIQTLAGQGCIYKNITYPVKNVDVKDNTGAGDTFLAGLVVKYVKTKSIPDAIEFANKCATYVIQKKGTTVVNINEI